MTSYQVRVLSTADRKAWKSLLPAETSVFGSVEFASLAEQHYGYAAQLFVHEQGESRIVYPIFLRPLSELPFAGMSSRSKWDIVSPSFTGPIFTGPIGESSKSFRQAFSAYCVQQGIVAEFAHLHPWRQSPYQFSRWGLIPNREIVYVDLSWSEDEIWKYSFAHSCRKNIVRAGNAGLETRPAQSAQEIKEFHRIYTETMDRNQAERSYYFPADYFLEIFLTMSDHSFFMLARHRGRIVAGTLYLHDGFNIYSYLGGADHGVQELRPTNAVIYETIRWGLKRGKRRLILGGGYRPNDGIFRFKSTFSPFRVGFYVFKHVHLKKEYSLLCQAWSLYNGLPVEEAGYFPAYRTHIEQHSYAKA